MARLVWIGVGAAGGIYAYRKGEQLADRVREQGLAGTAQMVAASLVANLAPRTAADTAPVPQPAPGVRIGGLRISLAGPPATSGAAPSAAIMDTGVVDITDAARPKSERRRKVR